MAIHSCERAPPTVVAVVSMARRGIGNGTAKYAKEMLT